MLRWLAIFVVALTIMTPALVWGPGATDSGIYNFIWTRQFGEAMASGQFYPRWLPDSFEGLGSPTFYFYPPFAFWVSGALDALGFPTLQAINGAAVLLLLGSGASMYAWLRYRGTRPLTGACLYMLAPYHLIDVYARGALGEFAAFVWMPLIALGLEALPKRWAVPLLAVSFAGLIVSNLPVALLVSIFLIAPFGLHRVWRDRSVLLPGALAGGLGVALAAFYLLPALTLQEHVTTSLLWGAYYKPSSWFLWNGPSIVFLFLLPPIALAMAMLSLPARSVWSVITVVAALAAVGLIPFVWDIPLLARTQFPWRLLCVVEFAAITALTARPPRPVWFALAAAVLMFPYLTGISRALNAIHKPVDEAELARVMPDAPEYLPRGFDVSDVRDLQRSVNLAPYRKLPRAPAIVVPRRAHVTLHRAAFPIWRVEKNGVDVPTHGPLISFDATPGVYRVVRVTLWQEWIGGLVSLAAAMLLAGWFLLVRGGPAGARRRPRTPATQS